jgi:hypothetical protein
MKTTKPPNSGYIWSKPRLQTKFTLGESLSVIWMEQMSGYQSSTVFQAVELFVYLYPFFLLILLKCIF